MVPDLIGLIVVRGADLRSVPGRTPGIDKTVYFENGAAAYHVGRNVSRIPYGVECGEHSHRAQESFFVLSGTGCITALDTEHHVQAGDTVVVPWGVPHNLRGTSQGEDFVVLCDLVRVPGRDFDSTPWEAPIID